MFLFLILKTACYLFRICERIDKAKILHMGIITTTLVKMGRGIPSVKMFMEKNPRDFVQNIRT